jgi:DNA-binding response OmpR family regulator
MPCILIVDDDRRVLDLLEIAFQGHGFRVVTAADGDQAIQRIASDSPDLVVLDVRLPKKSGLEVCEIVRRDPTASTLPIILVSGAADTDSRLRGLACGADDFVAKPFSPKELIARTRRILARSAEAREAGRRADEFMGELHRVKTDVQRSHEEAQHERRLREIVLGPGRDLQRTLDLDEICRTLLVTIQLRVKLGATALLIAPRGGDTLEPRAVRGDLFERLHGLSIPAEGGLAAVVAGLGRVVKRSELESLRDLREATAPVVAAGFTLLAPLRGPEGLVALLLAEEPHDGHALDRTEVQQLMGLCEIAAIAIRNAQRASQQADALIRGMARAAVRGPAQPADGLSSRARGAADDAWRDEAREIVTRAAIATGLPPRWRELLALAVLPGLPEANLDLLADLERAAHEDPTGRMGDLLDIERLALGPAEDTEVRPELRRAALLLFVARRYARARIEGLEPAEALLDASVQAGAALDPATALALNGALREPV